MTDELKRLHNAASPAPWLRYPSRLESAFAIVDANDKLVCEMGPEHIGESADHANRDLIVALRNAYADGSLIPAERYQGLVKAAEAALPGIERHLECMGDPTFGCQLVGVSVAIERRRGAIRSHLANLRAALREVLR